MSNDNPFIVKSGNVLDVGNYVAEYVGLTDTEGSCLFSTPEIGLIIWLGSSFNDQSFGSPRSVKVRTLFVTVPALACYDLHAPQEAFPSNR